MNIFFNGLFLSSHSCLFLVIWFFRGQFAKSARSTCKKCKDKIAKGDKRIGTHSDTGDFTTTSWVHGKPRRIINLLKFLHGIVANTFSPSTTSFYAHTVSCFGLPRKFTTGADKMSVEDFVDNILRDESEDGSLLTESKEEIVSMIGMKAVAVKKAKEDDPFLAKLASEYAAMQEDGPEEADGGTKMNGKKRKVKDEGDDDNDDGKKKRAKKGSEEQDQRAVELYGMLHKFKGKN